MPSREWAHGVYADSTAGMAYAIIQVDDVSDCTALPPLSLMLGPGRRTVAWRGKRFNVGQPRVIGVEWGRNPQVDATPSIATHR